MLADRLLGGFFGILGLLHFFEAYHLWSGWDGAGLMPLIVGILYLFLTGAFLVFPSRVPSATTWFAKKELRHIAVLAGSYILYVSLMNLLGYALSTWIFLAAITKYISGKRVWIISVWTGLVAIGTNFIFKKYLGMYLPMGFINF